ncbi:unnamed protein product [Rhodiola kirilowii]
MDSFYSALTEILFTLILIEERWRQTVGELITLIIHGAQIQSVLVFDRLIKRAQQSTSINLAEGERKRDTTRGVVSFSRALSNNSRCNCKMLRPWEQHCNVIIIPRFDYNAPSSLLHHSHSGFLITCPIKREKSATKEAMSILEKVPHRVSHGSMHIQNALFMYLCHSYSGSIEGSTADEMIGESTETNEALSITSHDAAKKLSKSSPSLQEMSQENGNSVRLSLVKLTKSGLLLFVFPNDKSLDTTDIVSSVFQSLESGGLKPPRWCCRIFPIQATCNLNEKELHAVVLKLVREFVQGEKNKLTRPVKYAVGFNRRGIGEKELKTSNYSNDTGVGALLDRNKCFEVVGSAVKDVIPDSVVDLNNPELSILVELLPLSGVPNGSPVVAVAVLPPNFVVTKPKLCVKALLSSSNMTDKAL